MSPTQTAELNMYLPWFQILGVFVLFFFLRFSRQALRRRVDEIGYRLMRERGLLIWFWLNAPGVMLHEMSHALMVLLFYPFGFRITSITLFRVQPKPQRSPSGRVMQKAGRLSLQLGEVQYVRPQHRFMSYVGDGFSGIAPLFGGILMFLLLYWLATGNALWENITNPNLQIFRPGWPWWTLIFTPYLILTVTSELWPSRQDWRGARYLVVGLLIIAVIVIAFLWYAGVIVFNNAFLHALGKIALYIDFAFLVLFALDIVFILIAEAIVQAMRR